MRVEIWAGVSDVPKDARIAPALGGAWGALWYMNALVVVLDTDVPIKSVESVIARIIMNARNQRALLDNSLTHFVCSLTCEAEKHHYPFQYCSHEYHDHYNS